MIVYKYYSVNRVYFLLTKQRAFSWNLENFNSKSLILLSRIKLDCDEAIQLFY
jgi:hypothetical protein